MYALSGERILLAWERSLSMPEACRSLALLETALPGTSFPALTSMPLSERNARLLELRALSFGNAIEAFAKCPLCDAPLEFRLNTDDLRRESPPPAEDTWLEAETEFHMRAANSADLVAVQTADTDDEACALLLARTMGMNQTELTAEAHPDWLARFERLNASAEITCSLACDACAARTEIDFDIAGFLWREVATAARRLLAEIHRLASAYGWSESSILALSPARRHMYLEMLNV